MKLTTEQADIVTAADFYAYMQVQRSGRYNMLGYAARRLTGLSILKYEYILNNYSDLERRFGNVDAMQLK